MTTRKRRSNQKNRKTCINTKCKTVLKNFHKIKKKSNKSIEKKYKELLQQEIQICNSKSLNSENCQKLKEEIGDLKYLLDQNNKKQNQKESKSILSFCKKWFCNKTCKGTVYEDGNPDELPKSFLKKIKESDQDSWKKQRKEIFGEKTSVLKDGFYEGLKKEDIVKLQKEGAISSCIGHNSMK
jgi:hypothetical protein